VRNKNGTRRLKGILSGENRVKCRRKAKVKRDASAERRALVKTEANSSGNLDRSCIQDYPVITTYVETF